MTDLYFLAAIDICRGQGKTSNCPAVLQNGRWRLRGGAIRYENRALWVVFGPRWSRRRDAEDSFEQARRIILHSPAKILLGMCGIAKRYGTLHQLDGAIGRAVALTFGPLLPAGLPEEGVSYVAATWFFEIGNVPTAQTHLPRITCAEGNLEAYLEEEQLKRRSAGEMLDSAAQKRKDEKISSDVQYLSGVMERVNIDALRTYSSFQILATTTWSVFALIVRAIGMDWNTFHTWYLGDTTLYDHLIKHFPVPQSGGQNALTTAVAHVMKELFNLTWPTNGLPKYVVSWSIGLPETIIRAIGSMDAVNFGNVARSLGWLDIMYVIPDLLCVTKGKAFGNLRGTVRMPDALRRMVAFDVYALFARECWYGELMERDTSYDPRVVNEVNLFVGVLTYAAETVARQFAGPSVLEWDLMTDDERMGVGRVAIGDWNWMLDGQAIIDHFWWRRVRLNANENDIEMEFIHKPDWLDWTWLPVVKYINPSTSIYKIVRDGVQEIWLPYLNLDKMPVSIAGILNEWCGKDGNTDKMKRTYWYSYRPAHLNAPIVDVELRLPQFKPTKRDYARPLSKVTPAIEHLSKGPNENVVMGEEVLDGEDNGGDNHGDNNDDAPGDVNVDDGQGGEVADVVW